MPQAVDAPIPFAGVVKHRAEVMPKALAQGIGLLQMGADLFRTGLVGTVFLLAKATP